MNNKNDFKEEKFNCFLNKTIILSSRQYHRNEVNKNLKEYRIIDDENYKEYLNNYLKYDLDFNFKNKNNFINLCENSALINALKSLSSIEMTVIFLLFEERFTSNEASKILKICSDSVTRIKRRALKKIEKYFKGSDENE